MSEGSNLREKNGSGDDTSPAGLVAEARALLESVRQVPFTNRALLEFSSTFDPTHEVTAAAFREAIAHRRAEEFTKLYVASDMAGKLPGARVLAEGAPLFTELNILMETALELEGDLRGAILQAVRSGRLAEEREGSLFLLLWFWREKHGVTETDHELIKAQRRSALGLRRGFGGGPIITSLMEILAALSNDPDLVRLMGYEDGASREALEPAISSYRKLITRPHRWEKILPTARSTSSLGRGGTVTRIVERVGRNDPCPCGSGKKYKKCCADKDNSAGDYAIDGQPLAQLHENPELALRPDQVPDMRSYELYQLDPHKLMPGVFEEVVIRLLVFREFGRVREMLEAGDAIQYRADFLDQLAIEFAEAGHGELLRWLQDHPELEFAPYFKAEILLAEPARARELIADKVAEAHRLHAEGELGARVAFVEVAEGAAALDPAFGLVMARGTVPFVESVHFDLISEIIDGCRLELGWEGPDPSFAWMDNEYELEEQKEAHRRELEKQRAEAEKRVRNRQRETSTLKKQLADLQSELAEREQAGKEAEQPPGTRETEDAGPDDSVAEEEAAADRAKLAELREQARRLKGNLKQEHEDHARDREALRIAQKELTRLTSKQAREEKQDSGERLEDDREEAQLGDLVEPGHSPRLPDYLDAFRQSLKKFDQRTVAGAITLAGKLAAADPAAWQGVRKLRGKPDTLRQKVGRHHRLLFKLGHDSLEVVELIHRRDLDRWIARR